MEKCTKMGNTTNKYNLVDSNLSKSGIHRGKIIKVITTKGKS